MRKLSRARMASLVCPTAPFLAPRSLCASRVFLHQSSQWLSQDASSRKPNYAAQPWRERPQLPKYVSAPEIDVENPLGLAIRQFRQACETRDMRSVMQLYPVLAEAKALSPFDTRRITQVLHVHSRQSSRGHSNLEVLSAAQNVALDIKRRTLPPHHFAFVHLFGIYKECQSYQDGHELWKWLVKQDERFVSQAAYGAAIELMAYGKLSSLPDLEDLYIEGLKRFPGTFAEYHLSPDAVVPYRDQPTIIPGLPIMLLQGILTARLLARDWRKAYLALDTGLRLYPLQIPHRFIELFMLERPLSEAYTALMLACRAGINLPPTQVTGLLTKMRVAIMSSPSMSDRMVLVGAMVNAIYAYTHTRASVHSIHIAIFFHALGSVLPGIPPCQDYEGVAADLRDIIVMAAHEITSRLLQAGHVPDFRVFETLISLSGKLRVPGLLTTVIQDAKAIGIDLGPIGIRSIITSAGLVKDKELIQQYWEQRVSASDGQGTVIPFEDWATLTKACRRAGFPDYAQSQLLKLSHAIDSNTEKGVIQILSSDEETLQASPSINYMLPGDLTLQIDKLKEQMSNIEAVIMSKQSLGYQNSPFHMHIDPDSQALGPAVHLRSVYDEMTTDPRQLPPLASAEGASMDTTRSSTGISLDELRFQNWVTIAEMMDEAEAYESSLKLAADEAAKAGNTLPTGAEVFQAHKPYRTPCYTAQQVRAKVLALRTSHDSDVSLFRKTRSQVPDGKFKAMAYKSAEDKWVVPKLRKFATSEQQGFKHSDEEKSVEHADGPLKLKYYVGMQSDHEAPWVNRKYTRVVKRDGNGIAEEFVPSTRNPDEDSAADKAG